MLSKNMCSTLPQRMESVYSGEAADSAGSNLVDRVYVMRKGVEAGRFLSKSKLGVRGR